MIKDRIITTKSRLYKTICWNHRCM